MSGFVLDSGGATRLAERSQRATASIAALREAGMWPPLVLSPVLIECLQGDPARDAAVNRLLKMCGVVENIAVSLARRAAYLRAQARTGSAVDALVVAAAEPGGRVLTSDPADLDALAAHADDVIIERA